MRTTSDTIESLIAEFDPKTAGGASKYANRLRQMRHDEQCYEIGNQMWLDKYLNYGRPSWMQRMARAAADETHGSYT